MGKKIREWAAIDIRSLALFRMGLALVVLWDLCSRLFDLTAFYTDSGVMPRSLVTDTLLDPWMMSFHLLSGLWQIQLILFSLAIVFAIALLIGYKTRLATILTWVFLISLQGRAPLILQGGDMVMRLLLFWSIFLPLGSYLSVDQLLKKTTPPKQLISIATLGLLLQVCFIYWFTALLKTDSSWRTQGTAVWYALNLEQLTTPLGAYLLQFPSFLQWATFFTFYLELLGPFFAFSPFWTAPLRTITAFTFILFHLIGLNLTMHLGHFCYICAVAWIVFIPSWFWDKVWSWKSEPVPWKPARLSSSLALFFIVYILLWNVKELDPQLSILPEKLVCVGNATRVDQYWNMFSPFPIKEDGWWVIPAKLRDGTEVDLYTGGGEVSFEKPQPLFESDRWRSYMMNLFFEDESQDNLLSYSRYLTTMWNTTHPYEKQALSFDIFFMLKYIQPDGPTPPVKTLLWQHDCMAEQDLQDQ